jgi:hypothetical protein
MAWGMALRMRMEPKMLLDLPPTHFSVMVMLDPYLVITMEVGVGSVMTTMNSHEPLQISSKRGRMLKAILI